MHRPLVPRILAKSTETQRNAAKIVFVDFKWLATQAETPCPASQTQSAIARFYSRSHNAVIRVYDDGGNVIETHEHTGDFKEW